MVENNGNNTEGTVFSEKNKDKYQWFDIKFGEKGCVLKIQPKANEPMVDIFLSNYQCKIIGNILVSKTPRFVDKNEEK